MLLRLQHDAVDAIKRHAITMSVRSPRAQAYILTEYLWIEEATEQPSLKDAIDRDAPAWLGKLLARQLEDEQRHAELLRARLGELGATPGRVPRLAHAKLWWLERAIARYTFAAGAIVPMLAVAAQFEATGVRILERHLGALAEDDPTAGLLRSILADEQRHAKSCAAAARRLVRDDERDAFEALRARVATIDRAFGVTIAVRFWVLIAALAAADRLKERQ